MEAFIIYKGKYEATHQYAKWLAAAVHYPVFETDEVDGRKLSALDCFIIGGSVYMGKWLASKWVNQNISYLKNKKILIFIVCGTAAENKEQLDEIARLNIPEEIRNQSSIYFLPGRMIREKLSLKDRFISRLGAMMAKDPVQKNRMLKNYDDLKKEHILPMVNEIGKLQEKLENRSQVSRPVS